MATEELVTEQFQFLGIDIKDDVLKKCVDLCNEYDIDAESFVEQWMAFSLSHLNGAAPTADNLDLLVRKEFSKQETKLTSNHDASSRVGAGAGLTVYGAPVEEQPETDVLSNYISSTPKRIKTEPVSKTPNQQNELRPATFSPTVARSAKYSTRTNAGTVLHSFGDEKLLQDISKPSDLNVTNVTVTQMPNEDGELFTKAMFGFELLNEKASVYDNHIRYLSQYIMKKHGISETVSVRHKSQSEVYVAGRVECDADARLNPKCVVLQGTWDQSLSQSVPVDLDNVKEYALFPGQVVVMRGTNPRGDRFIATEVIADAALPPSSKEEFANSINGTLSMVVASGPYTTSDSLAYEPLKDLLAYVSTNRPHVVILTGPFLDCEHAHVKDNTMAESYKSFFEKLVDNIADVGNVSPHTKFCIVSSSRDAFHVNVYPTPPYTTRRRHVNVTFLPDPCTISVTGLLVTVTSTDVLMQIGQEEISLGAGGDKLSRVCRHVLGQQSAAMAGTADSTLWAAHGQLSVAPHLLLAPSNFRYFVKEVNGCVCVNPEHLTKGAGGGSLARLAVSPTAVAVQVLRI